MTKPKWTPIKIPLGSIQAWEQNPRMSTKAQALRIIESEKKFNQVIPFIVSPTHDGKVTLYDGHQRLAAWRTIYPDTYVMDAMQADRDLTEDEHKELIITLHTGATGSWNWDALSAWQPAELQAWGMNGDTLRDWNMNALNLREMMGAEVPIDYQAEWQGMPEFEQKDLSAWKSITIHFDSMDNFQNFAELVGQTLTEKTKSIWYPKKEREDLLSLVAHAEP